MDGVLIQQLKESVCHLDATIWGVREYHFSVISPLPGRLLDYRIKLSDEGIIAAMGMFFPSVFCLPSDVSLMNGQEPPTSDREDLLDDTQEILCTSVIQIKKDLSIDEQFTELMTGPDLKPGEVGLPEVTRRVRRVDKQTVLPLDQAVHFSIGCASEVYELCMWYMLVHKYNSYLLLEPVGRSYSVFDILIIKPNTGKTTE